MIKQIIKLIFLFSITASYSQNSINSAGGDLQTPSVNVSYSIGQLKINSIKTSLRLDFNQGVQHAFDIYDCNDYNQLKISIFPNPTSDILNISFVKLTDKLTLRIFDLAGRFVNEEQFLTNDIKIDMSNYANGIYILSFYNFCGLFKSFKVVVNK
jgi:hypothetical protein